MAVPWKRSYLRSTDDEAAGRLDVVDGVLVEELVWNDDINDLLHEVRAQLIQSHLLRVLHRDYDCVHAGRHARTFI